METPRPILDLDNLEEYPWPEIDWSEMRSEPLEWYVNSYRILQKHLMITYKDLIGDDDPKDPDPYAKYYVFYCLYASPINSRPSFEPTNISPVPTSAIVECCGIDLNSRTCDTIRTATPAQNIST